VQSEFLGGTNIEVLFTQVITIECSGGDSHCPAVAEGTLTTKLFLSGKKWVGTPALFQLVKHVSNAASVATIWLLEELTNKPAATNKKIVTQILQVTSGDYDSHLANFILRLSDTYLIYILRY